MWPLKYLLREDWRIRDVRIRRSRRKKSFGGNNKPPEPDDEEDDSSTGGNGETPPGSRDPDAPLPRPKRRPRRAKADRGLPPDEELAQLARVYLERQCKHWPELVQADLLPKPTEDVLRAMVEDFKERHRGAKVDPSPLYVFLKYASKLAGNYNRYSCDNSSPLSIIDQMVNSLDKARSETRFIPWVYIFCDYSVTGLDAGRQGYTSYKCLVEDEKHLIETTYIDDFTRASRDEAEWWSLAAMTRRLNKRLIGATDHFDVSAPQWDIVVTVDGLLSRMFIKGLREKVRRGMKGAARRGTCLGKLSLGFTRQICRDANSNVIYRPDGSPRHKPCWDPETKPYRELIYELFVKQNWSPYKIAKHFNCLRVDGSNGWTGTAIKNLLKGMDAIGIFVWNRHRKEYDYEKKKWVNIENPNSERIINKDPTLAIVSKELWRAAWLKLLKTRKAHPLTGKKWSRNQISATTLFSGTLFCAYCGDELRLNRSAGKYKVMSCLSGSTGVHDCRLTTSKSTQIVEDCLLGSISNLLLTHQVIEDRVKAANVYLVQEARKPQVDTAPMKANLTDCQTAIKKLVRMVEKEPDEEMCDGYHSRIKELQKEAKELKDKIREAESHNQKPPPPLDVDRVNIYLIDMRGLLNQEIPMAAEALRTLTGPIKICQEKIPGKRGACWIASFTPHLGALLQKLAKDNGYPDAASLAAIPADSQPIEVVIEKIPKYERLAPMFKAMKDKGVSVQTIAAAHKMSWVYAQQILEFAETGKRPNWGSGKHRGTGLGKPAKYPAIAQDVVRMRDEENMSFLKIAAKLGVSAATAKRAYDALRPEAVQEAAAQGKEPQRGRYSHLGMQVFTEIRKMLREGQKPKDIATQVGCGISTIARVRRKMQAESGDNSTA